MFMENIYQEILKELGQSRAVILATIIRQKGSSPRSQGTQFMIRADGSFQGTIGGGRLEADVLAEAPKVFSDQKNRIIYFRLKGEEVAQTEMICGGEVDVYLELLSPQEKSQQEAIGKILEAQQKGSPGLIATLLETNETKGLEPKKILFDPEAPETLKDLPWGTSIISELPPTLAGNRTSLISVRIREEEKLVFLEPLIIPSTVYLFGAGHISLSLCPLAKMVGFRVVVLDDRSEFANMQRFPLADKVEVQPFEVILQNYTFGPNAFIVIITRGHLHDHQILRSVLKGNPGYIGMIGSRHKRAVVFKALKEEGFTEERIRSVYSPIGLDIKAETPEEIAVSIVAELIQVRGQKRPQKKEAQKSSHHLLHGES
jgi:xanthine dehydrogenase accessory factor